MPLTYEGLAKDIADATGAALEPVRYLTHLAISRNDSEVDGKPINPTNISRDDYYNIRSSLVDVVDLRMINGEIPDKESAPQPESILSTVNTSSHRITGTHSVKHSKPLVVETGSNRTLQELVDGTVNFWNHANGSRRDFTVKSVNTDPAGEVQVIIQGTVSEITIYGSEILETTLTLIATPRFAKAA